MAMSAQSGSLTIRAVLPEDLASELLACKPKSLSTSGFAALLIEQGLTGWLNYAPTVSVRETPSSTGTKAQPSSEVRQTSQEVQSSSQEHTEKNSSVVFLGDGVGREPEGGGRKGPSFIKATPEKLTPFQALIDDYWRVKQGSKGKIAWDRLMRNLTAFLDKYGEAIVRDQLELAVNGKWMGIELARYEQLKASGKPPETKHPAAQVFTAKDFDKGPTTNSALSDLF